MNITDPIFVPDVAWTKETIHEQLDNDDIAPEDISDEDAVWWVEKESEIRFEAVSYGEDYYGRTLADVNYELVQRSK